MKIIHTFGVRLAWFWLLNLLTVHILLILVLAAITLYTPSNATPAYAISVLIPFFSLLYGWLFFRNVDRLSLNGVIEVALAWTILFVLVTAALDPILYGIPWRWEFNSIPLIRALFIFLFVFGTGWRRMNRQEVVDPKARREPGDPDALQ